MNRFRLLIIFSLVLIGVSLGAQTTAKATFAGGCFWCMEEAFDKVEGVSETVSGYSGGNVRDPSYNEVSSGTTGHTEVVQVTYDPDTVTYRELLYFYWRNIDLLDAGGQFCDRGSQYRTAIFYHDEGQRRLAQASKGELSGRFSRPTVTEITRLDKFYPAEDYHQDYYKKNNLRYHFYVTACGRYTRLEQVWGDEARPKKAP